MKKYNLLLLLAFIFTLLCKSQTNVLYKQIDSTKLYLHVYKPDNFEKRKKHPAIIFFFGGGWAHGTAASFERQAIYFANRGLVCFTADYRVKDKNNTTPFEALKDAKSALRFIRINAALYHIDPEKIIASGGSAGGHLAAAASVITDYNETTDDLNVSCVPNVLALFNPVIDNGPEGFGNSVIGDKYIQFSPIHNIKKGMPPTIFLIGSVDKIISVETAKKFKEKMDIVGSRCDLKIYEGQGHGFFQQAYYKQTVEDVDIFLQSLGYLKKKPLVEIVNQGKCN